MQGHAGGGCMGSRLTVQHNLIPGFYAVQLCSSRRALLLHAECHRRRRRRRLRHHVGARAPGRRRLLCGLALGWWRLRQLWWLLCPGGGLHSSCALATLVAEWRGRQRHRPERHLC